MVADQPVGHALGMAMPTGPAVLGRMRYHPGPHRVQFDISAAGQQILLAIHGRRLEAAFPQGAAAPIGVVEMPHIAPADRLHPLAEAVRRRGRGQDVDVVGHQHIGMNGAAGFLRRIAQAVEIKAVIRVGRKCDAPIIAALNQVVRQVRDVETTKA